MGQRDEPKRTSVRGPLATAPTSDSAPEASEVLSPTEVKRALLLDHLHDRIDQLCMRLDALGSRIDSQQTRLDMRMIMIEAELRELPGMIERGMRAALEDEANGT